MKINRIYTGINDRTWILQAIFDFVLILFYYRNPRICSFLQQFEINGYLMFAILGFGNFVVIRLFVLFLSWIIYMLKKD